MKVRPSMKAAASSGRNPLTIRPPAELHEMLSEAASWLGVSLNSLVLEAAADRAREILETQRQIKLSRQDAELFFGALENPPAPNAALKSARQAYQDLIRE